MGTMNNIIAPIAHVEKFDIEVALGKSFLNIFKLIEILFKINVAQLISFCL